jgi:hypothetical protein
MLVSPAEKLTQRFEESARAQWFLKQMCKRIVCLYVFCKLENDNYNSVNKCLLK